MNAEKDSLSIVALVPGDCTGIGPEQTARILSDDRLADVARLVVVGDARVLGMGMAHCGVKLGVERVASPAKDSFREGVVPLVDRSRQHRSETVSNRKVQCGIRSSHR